MRGKGKCPGGGQGDWSLVLTFLLIRGVTGVKNKPTSYVSPDVVTEQWFLMSEQRNIQLLLLYMMLWPYLQYYIKTPGIGPFLWLSVALIWFEPVSTPAKPIPNCDPVLCIILTLSLAHDEKLIPWLSCAAEWGNTDSVLYLPLTPI